MGEVVFSNEEEEQVVKTAAEENPTAERKKTVKDGGGGGGGGGGGNTSGVVKWESLFSGMMLRVLLVEADDSTRQIIAALLRKCSYRVAAVPDGLKAWELLKGKPHNIDLILTEVDLPSISGFALLTLIMEHEICKSIPVIMMSSQDSISTVYKCMFRGAADYLVKPLRRNELRNLWQHVWRRRSLSFGGNGAQDESVGQQKVEATAENNAASNHSSGSMGCVQRNKDYIEKGSDAQSSCTKPDLEAESAPVETMQDFSQPTGGKSSRNDAKVQNHETYARFGEGSAVGICMEANTATSEPKIRRRDASITNEACDVVVNSSKAAIDFMGASSNHISSNNGTNKFDSTPSLDLSLRRSHPSGLESGVTEERCTLRPSDSSAFTRYTHRPLQLLRPTLIGDCDQQKGSGSNSENNFSYIVTGYKSDAPGPMFSTRSVLSFATGQSNQSGVATSSRRQRVLPVPVPVKRINNLCTGYGSGFPSVVCAQSGPSLAPSPSSAGQQELAFRMNTFHQTNFEISEQVCDQFAQNTNNSTYQSKQKRDHILDSVEDRGRISPTTDQSTSSSFCNGGISRLNSMGYGSACGSNGNADQLAVSNAVAESKNEEGCFSPSSNSHRSIQREAALTKFRLKRKDRCYEKKVRYESRKKLAEQRPRVKGQFVRQVHPEALLVQKEYNCGNSLNC